MKISKLVVTDESGAEHIYVGEGHITQIRSQSYAGPGAPPLQLGIDAHLVWNSESKDGAK